MEKRKIKDLQVNDIIYILNGYNEILIHKVTKIITYSNGEYKVIRVFHDYANKYTDKDTQWYNDISLGMCGDDTSYTEYEASFPYTLYLNSDDVLKELNDRIDMLNKQKEYPIGFIGG